MIERLIEGLAHIGLTMNTEKTKIMTAGTLCNPTVAQVDHVCLEFWFGDDVPGFLGAVLELAHRRNVCSGNFCVFAHISLNKFIKYIFSGIASDNFSTVVPATMVQWFGIQAYDQDKHVGIGCV